jgi:hypothetical protein
LILVEIRPRGGKKQTIAVHPGVTVLRGLDPAARRTWATDLARALRGETSASLDLEVEIDGRKRPLSSDLISELGLGDAASAVTVFAVDRPGAKSATAAPAATSTAAAEPAAAAAEPTDEVVALEADLSAADANVARLTAELAEAERAAASAADERTSAGRGVAKDTAAAVTAAEGRLDAARAAAATARRQLDEAEAAARTESEQASSKSAEDRDRLRQLQTERDQLEASRTELLGRMVENGDPGDPKPVEEALAGLRRLRSVKPKPSAKAVDLADRWVAARQALDALPQPPQPPEWLVIPALAALQEARDALALAEAGTSAAPVDPAKIEALDRAHREVLEAEQRTMKKGSRLNRRRLDGAHEAEQAALSALGVSTYGEYLQRIAPTLEDPSSGEDRVAAARAALADAEAVWEELHGGQASPEWTKAKEQQAAVRTEALNLVGHDVDDDVLEDALRSHLETVVDTEWAEQALLTALRGAGAAPAPGADVEAAAEQWLTDAPALQEARGALEAELSELDGRLAAVEEQLAEHQADAFFGDDVPAGGAAPAAGPVAALRRAAEEADAAEAEAERSLRDAQSAHADAESAKGRLAELETAAGARRADVDRLRTALDDARSARDVAKAKAERASRSASAPEAKAKGKPAAAAAGNAKTGSATAGANGDAASNGAVDLSGVVGMEAEAYLLARVAALRGAPGGPLPLVLDGEALAGLSEGAARRVFRLLGRLAGSMQLVVLGDDGEIATWAAGLGDQAAVRDVAR